ncbi:ComEC/Rec2 family competence protein [Flavivirga eckloniae]|uniref:Metallo-beta-lactamase domain-containing protein n=1 Tax=Flavivirga eckloniae TaxID=1803846 RepID=A0A2K9PK32_9FLAO|nr:hypothetical protein [Flavivirga eckloniae]AUP77386.1 hypothetical protein C1H87_01080 [Flavivirga eckloniae]
MAKGWIRAYSDEYGFFKNKKHERKDRSIFRKAFTTVLYEQADEHSLVLKTLKWGDEVILPDGIGSDSWTKTIYNGQEGFVRRWHLVEIGFLAKDPSDNKSPYTTRLKLKNTEYKKELLWGDLIQITKREADVCHVRARGWYGKLAPYLIQENGILDVSFIDVGQGDGLLVRFPEGKHMLIDGGLERVNQMTGKNAADFVDWKFFFDYGDYCIRLDAMMASHCDADHYGGLWDMIKRDPEVDEEIDCIDFEAKAFYHAGLSTWVKKDNTHKDKLGPTDDGWFVRLLEDREDAERCMNKTNEDTLNGDWKSFIKKILALEEQTPFFRVGVKAEDLADNKELPEIWKDDVSCNIKVLGPVTQNKNGKIALKDLGDTGKNKNGHSICLRLDYGNARILLTGDLNTASMNWLSEAYGDRIDNFNCDVAKACHHGSHDISYKFLKHINAGATIISSGDAEGYSHPRPEIVAASAVTGHMDVDLENDRLRTPLIYMTEIERSVSLGKVSHIKIQNHPNNDGSVTDKAILALKKRNITNSALLSEDERDTLDDIMDKNEKKAFKKDILDREKALLLSTETAHQVFNTNAQYHYKSVHKLFSIKYGTKPVKKTRILTKNHYGLVNVRTDGETIMCATMKESGEGWTIHTFPARF